MKRAFEFYIGRTGRSPRIHFRRQQVMQWRQSHGFIDAVD